LTDDRLELAIGERLATLRRFGNLQTPGDAVLDTIVALAARFFSVPVALISILDETQQRITAAVGLAPEELKRCLAFCESALSADVLIVSDARSDVRFANHALVRAGPKLRAFAGAPVFGCDGKKVGDVCIFDRRPRTLDPVGLEMLQSLARLVMDHFKLRGEARDAIASRNKAQAIIEASPQAILTVLPSAIVTSWNDGAERIFGWKREEVVGRRSPIIPPELREETAATRRRVEAGGIVRGFRTYRVRKDGARIEVEVSAGPVRDPSGAVFENVYLVEDVTASIREQAVERNRYEILELAANDGRIEDLFDRLVENVEFAISGTIASILRVRNGALYNGASGARMPEAFRAAIDALPIGDNVGACGTAAFRGETVICGDIDTDPKWKDFRDVALAGGLRACWSVPIRSASGITGTIACYAHTPRLPTDSEMRALNEAAHVASIVIEGHEARVKLEDMALRDSLTDLPNRTLFERRLRAAIAIAKKSGKRVGLILLDLDRFKIVNDNLGHAVGDQLLQEVASRLQRSIRPQDTIARMGGDEFLILLPEIDGREAAREIAARALATIAPSFAPGGTEIFVRASLGISIYPDDAVEPSQLLRLADYAMYEAKSSGVAIVCYDGANASDVVTPLAIETYLNHAVEKNEFELVYQPLVATSDGGTFAVEALLRWNNPELGRMPPDRFIGIAEETGLIISIGAWVLQEACRFSKRWSLAGGSGRVMVNVSPRQFQDGGFVGTVVSALADAGTPPENLYLEITESLIMRSPETVADTLADLRALGVRSVIDDFGSGYSSLNYLKRFPIDMLKIDKGFVSEIGIEGTPSSDEAIIRAIVAVGQALGLGVVAEGVETQLQMNFLRDAGCDFWQGYHLADPMTAAQLLGWSLPPSVRAGATFPVESAL
jgi:diguanylate cyclase (GGDEF)-like protein/PAS domain S-box-containing protein